MDRPHLIYSSINGHFVCVHTLAIANNATMNIGIHFLES